MDNLKRLLDSLQTGDVLLYSTNDIGASWNRFFQGSLWSHAGLVIRGEPKALSPWFSKDYTQGVEDDAAALCIFEAVPRRGTSLFPLKDRLARTIGTIDQLAVRRRQGPVLSVEQRAQLDSFVAEVLGRKLETSSFDMITALNPCRRNKHENWDEFFCSELVAEGLQQLGVLREEGLNSNDVLPRSFEKKSNFLNQNCLDGHSFLEEEMLVNAKGAKKKGDGIVKELKLHKQASKERMRARNSSNGLAFSAVENAEDSLVIEERLSQVRNHIHQGKHHSAHVGIANKPHK